MSRSTRAAAKDTASLSAKSKKPSAGLLQLPSDGDNDNGNDIVPTSDIVATVMTDPKADKTKKRKPSAVVRDATTQKHSSDFAIALSPCLPDYFMSTTSLGLPLTESTNSHLTPA